MGNIESMTRDILMEELTPDLVKRIAKALEINKHLTSTYALTVSVEDILSTDRNPDPSKSGFYFILEGTRSGVNFFYNNNLEFSRKPNSKSVRVVKRYNNLRGFEESFWLKWAEKWLKNPLTEGASETTKDKTGREFKISTEVFDSRGNELYCGKIAHTGYTWLDENDKVKKSDLLGYIDYSVIDNVAYINMIEVKESERRKGIATELIKSMEKDYDKVQWGYTTDDGTALHKGIYGEGLVEKIIKKKDGYHVTSEDGKKNLGGPYDTEDEAKKRLQQVHYFKNLEEGTKTKELDNNFNNLKRIEFYDLDGSNPVQDFILDIKDVKLQAKIIFDLKRLDDLGNEAKFPLSRYVEDGILEMRTQQGNNISRVFYFFIFGDKIVMTNGYIKKSQKADKNELKIAKKRRDKYMTEKTGGTK